MLLVQISSFFKNEYFFIANTTAIEALYTERFCFETEEWRELKRLRKTLISDNVIHKLMGPAKNYLWAKQKKLKFNQKQQKKKELEEHIKKKQEEEALGIRKKKKKKKQKQKEEEETLQNPASLRRPKQKKKPPPQQDASGTQLDQQQDKGIQNSNSFLELYDHVRMLYQAKRFLLGLEPKLFLDDDEVVEEDKEERQYLLAIRRGEVSEPQVCVKMQEIISELEALKLESKGKRPRAVEENVLDAWIVNLRKKEEYF
jgi:hypothetical protein